MENLEIDVNTDRDMFNEDPELVFPDNYQLKGQTAMGLDNTYVLHLEQNLDGLRLAVGLSTNAVAVYDSEDLVRKEFLPAAHEGLITGLRFSRDNPDLLFSCSADQTIKLWDLRDLAKAQPSKTFTDTSRTSNPKLSKAKPFTAFDINVEDKYICAGTEQVLDAFLLFWDIRGDTLLGGYWDSHEDDITTVKFHPESPNRLASSGTDGIVNVFDISQSSEDEALETSHNTESSVQKLTWFHNQNTFDSLAILTHTEELALWNVADFEPYKTFSREDICVGLRRKLTEVCYSVDIHEVPSSEGDDHQLMIVSGSSSPKHPCLRLLHVKKNKLKAHANLTGYGSQLTRASILNPRESRIFTGGEDGLLSAWSTRAIETKAAKSASKLKMKRKAKKH